MAYTLEQLSADIRAALKADPGVGGKQAVCKLVSKVLEDKEFAARYLTADQCKPRKVLYEDPELGFCICGPFISPAVADPRGYRKGGWCWECHPMHTMKMGRSIWGTRTGYCCSPTVLPKPGWSWATSMANRGSSPWPSDT